MSRKSKSFPHLRRWRRGARWARRKLARAPRAARIVGVVAILLVLVALTNLVYHVIRKPTELFAFVGDALDKPPAETWRQYGPLFRAYSTSTITPELLAALAQVESSGNPVARTYWRWRLSLNPFSIYQPASSAVGLFQMTDAAYAEAARSCVRENAVTNTGCGFTSLTIRAIPSHAIELASVYLARNVAAVLARVPDVPASLQQKQDLAAVFHLFGGGAPPPLPRPHLLKIARPRPRWPGKPAEEAGSRRVYPSLRGGPRHSLRAPQLSNDARRAVRRSSRHSLYRQGQCDEAAVQAPGGRWRVPELTCRAYIKL